MLFSSFKLSPQTWIHTHPGPAYAPFSHVPAFFFISELSFTFVAPSAPQNCFSASLAQQVGLFINLSFTMSLSLSMVQVPDQICPAHKCQ